MNDLLITLWPKAKAATETQLRATLEPLLFYLKPPICTKLELAECDLGNVPPLVTGVNTVWDNESVSLDISIKMAGETRIVLETGLITVQVKDLEVSGVLRVRFFPLCDENPGFRAVSSSFAALPDISFDLNALHGIPLNRVPGWL